MPDKDNSQTIEYSYMRDRFNARLFNEIIFTFNDCVLKVIEHAKK
jgi:hypothetical protein